MQQLFPDGTPIPAWFSDTAKVDVDKLGKRYVVTDYGVKNDSNLLQTEQIQAVIDRAATDGGGVVVIPQGTFLSGSIFFKQGTHLYLEMVQRGDMDVGQMEKDFTKLIAFWKSIYLRKE